LNFVDDYLAYTQHYESPRSFWKWSAYAILAAILRDNVFTILMDIKVCPNIYVLLLANSAVQRKDNPVDLCEFLVRSINNTKLISGRGSIQGIIDELQRAETDKVSGKILKGGSAIFCASELSAAIVQDPQAVNILTDIYKYREQYSERLRGRQDKFTIRNVCFTMLAASNKKLLLDVYDSRAIKGGLLGRTFLVVPDEFRPGNSLFSVNSNQEKRDKLIKKLEVISRLSGQFYFTDEAQKTYESWYIPFREQYKEREDESGIAGRIHMSVLKMAMLIAVDKTDGLEVNEYHVKEAIDDCIALMPAYNQFVMASGKSNNAEIGTIFLTELYNAPNNRMTRKLILQKHWNAFDVEQFDKLVSTLDQAGLVRQTIGGNEIEYQLTDKCKEILFKHHDSNNPK
jgi:hypothetical protein